MNVSALLRLAVVAVVITWTGVAGAGTLTIRNNRGVVETFSVEVGGSGQLVTVVLLARSQVTLPFGVVVSDGTGNALDWRITSVGAAAGGFQSGNWGSGEHGLAWNNVTGTQLFTRDTGEPEHPLAWWLQVFWSGFGMQMTFELGGLLVRFLRALRASGNVDVAG